MQPPAGNKQQTTVDSILEAHSDQVRRIAQELRSLVRSTVPEMEERAYTGWHVIGFRHPGSGYVCGIFPGVESVKLLFENGVLLSNAHGILEGEGKQTRYIEVGDVAAIPEQAIKLLLLEAVALKHKSEQR